MIAGVYGVALLEEKLAEYGPQAELAGAVVINAVIERMPSSLFLQAAKVSSIAWILSAKWHEPVALPLSERIQKQLPSFAMLTIAGLAIEIILNN